MAWRLARSIEVLRAEVDRAFPGRSKRSDGTIGDAAHATRTSDHNPFITVGGVGVVRAIDITHDPAKGCNAAFLAELFRTLGKGNDGRVRYVIWNRRIASTIGGWAWRRYSGSNPHTQHVHLSVSLSPQQFDRRDPWGIVGADEEDEDTMRLNDSPPYESGPHVRAVQLLAEKWRRAFNDMCRAKGDHAEQKDWKKLEIDGDLGPVTFDRVADCVAQYHAGARPKGGVIHAAQLALLAEQVAWMRQVAHSYKTGVGGHVDAGADG